ncbi:MAG: dynamin family protein [Myxococcota bacterium]|nr:dynamin family protein [Myxococcota bacterium]
MSESTTSIGNHRKLQQSLVSSLRDIRHLATSLNSSPQTITPLQEMQQRLEEDVFRIAIVGEFKRGKSTLINALLGQEILPSDVLPCSATLNRVTYGLQPKVELRFKAKAEEDEGTVEHIEIDQLSAYVTKLTPESEKRASDIEEAIVYFPTKYCRDKADIIDTPGLNDDSAMTNVTLKVLPEVDACVLVILAQSPFSAYEADFLKQMLTHDLGRVLFVVNRMDEIRRPRDRKRIVDLVRSRITKAIEDRVAELHERDSDDYVQALQDIGAPKIFAISGGLALDAKLEDDAELLKESGFPVFEASLERFLTVERGLVRLTMAANVIQKATIDLERQLSITLGSLRMEEEHFQSSIEKTHKQLETLQGKLNVLIDGYSKSKKTLTEQVHQRIDRAEPLLLENIVDSIANFEVTAEEITDEKDEVLKRLQKIVEHQFKINGEKLSFLLGKDIQEGLGKDLDDLQTVSAEAQQIFINIQNSFTVDDSSLDGEVIVGTLALASRVNPFTTLVSGAFSGYKMAGFKGAAVGGLSGAAAGYGTLLAGAQLVSMLAMPVTLPVYICVWAATAFGAWYGGKWATSFFFGQNIINEFKEESTKNLMTTLKQAMPAYMDQIKKHTIEHIDELYQNLINSIEQNLGASITQTSQVLRDLQNQRLSEGLNRDQQIDENQRFLRQVHTIQQEVDHIQDILGTLRDNNEESV